MTFNTGREFLSAIKEYGCFYNEEQELFVFHYNDEDAIAVYRISRSHAESLRSTSRLMGCPWETLLGFGGHIYDSRDSEDFSRYHECSEDWCDDNFAIGRWNVVYDY